MKLRKVLAIVIPLALLLFINACAGRRPVLRHSEYGGCYIKGRHYHNTHVFIGDRHIPSLCEWLKY